MSVWFHLVTLSAVVLAVQSMDMTNADMSALSQRWKLRITSPEPFAWVDTSLLSLGFTGVVPEGTDTNSLLACISIDGREPNCMDYRSVVLTSMSEGVHSVVACWFIPGFGSCFDHTFSVRQYLREEVPGRDQITFVCVHPFAHSAVQWTPSLGSPLPQSV